MGLFVDTSGNLKYQGPSGSPAVVAEANGNVYLAPMQVPHAIAQGEFSNNTNTFLTIGSTLFDPSAYFNSNDAITRTINLIVLSRVTAGVTGQFRIYNVTDGSPVASTLTSVTDSTHLSTASSNIALSIPADLPNSAKIYELQIRVDDPDPIEDGNLYSCFGAFFMVAWS